MGTQWGSTGKWPPEQGQEGLPTLVHSGQRPPGPPPGLDQQGSHRLRVRWGHPHHPPDDWGTNCPSDPSFRSFRNPEAVIENRGQVFIFYSPFNTSACAETVLL